MANQNQISNIDLYQKGAKVIMSCDTEPQIEVARKYIYAMYEYIEYDWFKDLQELVNVRRREIQGYAPLPSDMSLLERAEYLAG
jgi:hypothetical protein